MKKEAVRERKQDVDITKLNDYATARQREIMAAITSEGSERAAAKKLGIGKSTVSSAKQAVLYKAAARGYSPDHDLVHPVPDGFKLKGSSTLYDMTTGEAKIQWIKSTADTERQEQLFKEALAVMCSEVPHHEPIKAPEETSKDLLNVIPIGDPHHGLYAWALESGDDFDSDIARRLTLGAVDRLLESAPNSHTCIILPLGDVFHSNDQSNVTPGHKHQLDVDSRFVKVLGIGIDTYRHAIIKALEKHEEVIVRFVDGNHDPQAIWALAFTIQAYFSDNPRVKVDLSPSKFWYYRFGKVLIGATHGDTVKHDSLLGVMACDRAEDWGATKHRYWYSGHVHHQSVKEYPGVVCESFRTLAAKDAYAAGHGYRAGRDMVCITHHRDHGEIERHRCDIGMLK
ncbi:MAG: oxidoreductase [Candidatus Bathyarchaeia archaeon]